MQFRLPQLIYIRSINYARNLSVLIARLSSGENNSIWAIKHARPEALDQCIIMAGGRAKREKEKESVWQSVEECVAECLPVPLPVSLCVCQSVRHSHFDSCYSISLS